MSAVRHGAATYMIGSAFAFALMTLFVRLAGRGLPSQEIVTARAGLTLVFTFFMLRRAGVAPMGHNRRLLVLRGCSGFVALSCVYYAVTTLPLAEATVIQYLHPGFSALLAAKVLGERVRRGTLASLLLGVLGVLLIARPVDLLRGGEASLPSLGLLAAVGGALMTSVAYVIVRKLGQTEDPLVIVFYFPLIALPASIPAMWSAGARWPSAHEWLLLLLVGITTQVGQLTITRGLQLHEVGRASAYSYTQVLFATLLGAAFLEEVPTLWTLAGGTLIVGSAILARRAETTAAAPLASNRA